MVMAPLSGAFGGLLASGILKLRGFGPDLHAWRMIFGIEGVVTIGIALAALFLLTDRPETARWLTEEEKQLAIDRVKSERVASTVVLDKITKQKLLRGINPVTLATAFIFLLNNITVLGLSFFLPTIVATIYPDRTTIEKHLLTVPPYVVGGFFVILITTLSWRFDHRQLFIAAAGPAVVVGYAIFLATMNAHVRYGAIFLSASTIFTLGAMNNAQVSANVVSDTARTIAIGNNGKWARNILGDLGLADFPPNSHVWQHRRADFNVDIHLLGLSWVSHRERPQPCLLGHVHHHRLGCLLVDEV